MNKTTIWAELSPELRARAQTYVNEGWLTDSKELLSNALRRFLESHSSRVMKAFVVQDVQWSVHGID